MQPAALWTTYSAKKPKTMVNSITERNQHIEINGYSHQQSSDACIFWKSTASLEAEILTPSHPWWFYKAIVISVREGFTCSQAAAGSWLQTELGPSLEGACRGVSLAQMFCTMWGLCGRTDLKEDIPGGWELLSETKNIPRLLCVSEANVTYFCKHLEEVWQSSLLLLQDVLHLCLLLLLLCWCVNAEALQVVQIADDLA